MNDVKGRWITCVECEHEYLEMREEVLTMIEELEDPLYGACESCSPVPKTDLHNERR